MNQWLIAAAVLTFALLPVLAVAVRAGVADGLAALELGSVLAATILMLVCEGLGRQPFIDLAVVFVPMSAVGSLAFARLMER